MHATPVAQQVLSLDENDNHKFRVGTTMSGGNSAVPMEPIDGRCDVRVCTSLLIHEYLSTALNDQFIHYTNRKIMATSLVNLWRFSAPTAKRTFDLRSLTF